MSPKTVLSRRSPGVRVQYLIELRARFHTIDTYSLLVSLTQYMSKPERLPSTVATDFGAPYTPLYLCRRLNGSDRSIRMPGVREWNMVRGNVISLKVVSPQGRTRPADQVCLTPNPSYCNPKSKRWSFSEVKFSPFALCCKSIQALDTACQV